MPECGKRRALGLIPLPPWRNAVLARHMATCPVCAAEMAGIEEARRATWALKDFVARTDLWPKVQEALNRPEARAPRNAAVRWGWAAATAVGLAAAGILLLDFGRKNGGDLTPGVKFAIRSSTLYDKPAQAFIFQTQDEHTTFAWVEKQPEGERP